MKIMHNLEIKQSTLQQNWFNSRLQKHACIQWTLRGRDNLSTKDTFHISNGVLSYEAITFSTSKIQNIRTASLQGTKWLAQKCPFLRGSSTVNIYNLPIVLTASFVDIIGPIVEPHVLSFLTTTSFNRIDQIKIV